MSFYWICFMLDVNTYTIVKSYYMCKKNHIRMQLLLSKRLSIWYAFYFKAQKSFKQLVILQVDQRILAPPWNTPMTLISYTHTGKHLIEVRLCVCDFSLMRSLTYIKYTSHIAYIGLTV